MRGAALFALLVALTACAPPRDLADREATLIAWWCEDVAHGIARDPDELRTTEASRALTRIADWVVSGAHRSLPQHLRARLTRWPTVRSLLRSGILVAAEAGLLALAPDASGPEATLAQRIADSENHDRRTVEVLVLTLTQTDNRLTDAVRSTFIVARQAGDQVR